MQISKAIYIFAWINISHDIMYIHRYIESNVLKSIGRNCSTLYFQSWKKTAL